MVIAIMALLLSACGSSRIKSKWYMLDYLMAHPEDRDKKEYKNLEKLALNADVEMRIPQPANGAEQEKRPKTKYEHWKHDFAEELRNLENAAVRRDQDVNRDILRLQRDPGSSVCKASVKVVVI